MSNNPEIDLMIIDSLDYEYRSASDIANELEIDETQVVSVLQDLIDNQNFAIDKKGTAYRIVIDDDYLEFDDE